MLPMIVWLRIKKSGQGKGVRLWIPMFLVWPVILLLLLLLLPLMLLVDLILSLIGWGSFPVLRLVGGMGSLLSAARGLRVNVSNKNEKVHITIS